jgi:hypothetical protein
LTAAAGTTIYYTLDGTVFTTASPVYAGPLVIGATTLLHAMAVEAGWTTSPFFFAQYTVDQAPPVITPIFNPPSTTSGWNSGPVTVSFKCDDAGGVWACPDAVAFTNHGAGQTATVTATDMAGNQSTLTVTVNIDSVPPNIAIGSPLPGATVDSPSVTVSASIGQSLSGIQGATCNGLPASISGGLIDCTAQVRRNGR